jgi:hypothetical protein
LDESATSAAQKSFSVENAQNFIKSSIHPIASHHPIIYTSVKTGLNVEKAFQMMAQEILMQEELECNIIEILNDILKYD